MIALLVSIALAAPDSGPTVVRVNEPVHIDGVLDEADWERATPVTDFQRYMPSAGGAPPCATEVRFLQDDRFLYVSARVTDCDYRIRARLSPREKIHDDDQIGIYLDPFHDGRSGYIFYLNPLGVQEDIRNSNGEWNFSWDTAFTSDGNVTEDGYVIEVAFPWRSFRYPAGETEQTWGVIVTRKIPHLGSKYSFPVTEWRHPRMMSLAAPLTGVQPATHGGGLELIPGLTAGQAWPREDGSTTGTDPFHQVLRPSLDARLGITPDLGLTATLNPDFSQIEADVTDVRVNPRFAFRYREKRPFFMDGFDFFEDRSETLYSRSINEPIYGAKLAGQEGPVRIGLLNTLDRTPLPTVAAAGTPGFDERDVEGRTAMNNVLRAQVNAFATGFVGLTLADKRLLGDGDRPRSVGPGVFQAGALDFEIPMRDRWVAGASMQHSFTGVAGQTPTWGMANEIGLRRATGKGTGLNLLVRDRTPDYRLETGFSPLSGVTTSLIELNHRFAVDRWVDTTQPGLEGEFAFERDGDRLLQLGPTYQMRFADVYRIELAGGPIDQIEGGVPFSGWYSVVEFNSDPFAWLELEPTVEAGRFIDYALLVPGNALLLQIESGLVPLAWLRLDTTASWERFDPDVPGPDGQPQEATMVRNRVSWQFSRELGLRIIEEWTDGSADPPILASSVLLSWLRVPGTAAYLGYSEQTALDGTGMVERTVFAKATVLLRP